MEKIRLHGWNLSSAEALLCVLWRKEKQIAVL